MMDFTERWSGYTEQSWSERFAELDRRYTQVMEAAINIPALKSDIARLPELEAAYIEVVAKLDKAVEALGDIKNPIAYLEREAEKSGAEGLNSNAVILAKDYAFLQLLATNALAAIKGSSHD